MARSTDDIHRLGANNNNTTPHTTALSPGWKMKPQGNDLRVYYSEQKRNTAHQPDKVDDDATVPFTQEDVVLRSFDLTSQRRLPAPVSRALSEHFAIWWSIAPPQERWSEGKGF